MMPLSEPSLGTLKMRCILGGCRAVEPEPENVSILVLLLHLQKTVLLTLIHFYAGSVLGRIFMII